ncbi:MAG: glucosamine inositolphosphorylceramide transferase family protein [Janthinobacterium lividum]
MNRPIQDFLRPGGLQGAEVDAPPLPSRNVFYADSFVRQEAAGAVVYFELYDWRTRRGNISQLPYPWQPGRAPAPVLSFPHHLSYPFLHGPYCIPEAWVTNSVRMYDLRAPVTDPLAGQVLLEAPAVDTTLLEHQGRYWLFYTRADYDPMLHLFISYADALEGPWHDHPQNPVKINIRSARPAGPFFKADGKLYRPTQDCIRDYGAALTFNEVLTLTPTAYEEREVANVLSPHPGYPAGMHTVMAIDDEHTLVDFKRYRFIPMATLTMVWIRVAGLLQRLKSGR